MSQSDFQLAGLSKRGVDSWIVAISFAYSGKWNSRKLENPFHAFWNLVLLDLIDDLTPDTIVIPQFQLDLVDDAPLAPNDSISTTAQAQANEMTPDFTIAMFDVVRRSRHNSMSIPLFPATFSSWRDIKLRRMHIPLIVELKSPPTRRAKSRKHFRVYLEVMMRSAHTDLLKQVEHAFLMQPALGKIILLACCGEWWSWMIATRAAHVEEAEELIIPTTHFLRADSPTEINNTPHDVPERTRKSIPRKGKKAIKGMYREQRIPPPPPKSEKITYRYNPRQKASKTPKGEKEPKREKKSTRFKRYTDLGEKMETLKPNVEDAMPVINNWSLPILFGSEASAQRFSLIHRFLLAERRKMQEAEDQDDPTDSRAATPDESDEDEDDEYDESDENNHGDSATRDEDNEEDERDENDGDSERHENDEDYEDDEDYEEDKRYENDGDSERDEDDERDENDGDSERYYESDESADELNI